QLEVLVHALAQREAHQWVLSKRREEKPSGKPLCLGHRRVSPEPPAPTDERTRTRAVSSAREPGDHRAAQPRRLTTARGRQRCAQRETREIILPRSGLLEPKTRSDPDGFGKTRSDPDGFGEAGVDHPSPSTCVEQNALLAARPWSDLDRE